MKQKPCHTTYPPTVDRYDKFGQMNTLNFMEVWRENSGAAGEGVTLTIYDVGTGYVGAYPAKTRSAEATTQPLKSIHRTETS